MKQIKYALVLILILMISACSAVDENNDQVEISEAVEQTQASIGTSTPLPEPTNTTVPTPIPPTNTPIPTPTIVAPFTAEVSALSLLLRSGPGKFFPFSAIYPEGTNVIVSARTPNNEWVYVTVAESIDDAWEANSDEIGWMSIDFLDIDDKYKGLPLMYYPDDQILVVYVFDTDGFPVNGADVAVSYYGNGTITRQSSYSDSAGVALIYYPPGFLGKVVNVEIVGIKCASVIVDDDCRITNHIFQTSFLRAELPYSGFVDFTFEVSTMNVVGYVVDQFGTKVAEVQVRGERVEDGAYTYTWSDEEGNFILPIGPGNWDIFTRYLDPIVEGTHYSLPEDYEGATIILTTP